MNLRMNERMKWRRKGMMVAREVVWMAPEKEGCKMVEGGYHQVPLG